MSHKLLLADDSVTIQRVIELTFADEDVQVVAVGDGQQAIARVQSDRPDIVLADVGMPERDGYEVADFIKRTPELAHIPVLLLTGAFEPIDESRAQAVGCDGVLVKPFEPQMVINRVKDLLAGRRQKAPRPATPESQEPQPAVAGESPRAEFGAPAGSPQPAALSGSLEDYFDRLDAAFASLDGGTPPASIEAAPPPPPQADAPPAAPVAAGAAFLPADDLAGWDPDLTGDPERPARPAGIEHPAAATAPPRATAPAVAAIAAPAAVHPAPAPAPPTAPAVAVPSLAEAFAALLSAEQAQPVAPSRVRPGMLSDEIVEDLVRRVSDRITDRAVHDTVVQVAERLVREEIARIKGV